MTALVEGTKPSVGRKVRRALMFLPFLLPLVFLRSVPAFHHDNVRWVGIVILYIYAMPVVMDFICGRNPANYSASDAGWISHAFEYRALPWILLLKIVTFKVLALDMIARGGFDKTDCLGIAWLTGQTVGSYGIFVAHEFLHRRSNLDKAVAEILMVSVMYPHYCIEHIYGHHKNAATPSDPATARLGEPLYTFLPRSVFGGLIHSWHLERRRLARQGRHWFDARNRMLRYFVEVLALSFAVWYFAGPFGVLALLLQSVVAVMTLEAINYVQHYGLERPEIEPGRYARTDVEHSWSSEGWFSNGYWLNLGRHSDHHQAPTRPFQMLRRLENEPELPAGFPAMFLLAFVPPLWFRVMHPRVQAVRNARTEGPFAGDNQVRSLDTPSSTGGGISMDQANTGMTPNATWLHTDGGLALMFTAIASFIGLDLLFGPPVGFVVIAAVSLLIALSRQRSNARSGALER